MQKKNRTIEPFGIAEDNIHVWKENNTIISWPSTSVLQDLRNKARHKWPELYYVLLLLDMQQERLSESWAS